MSSKERKRTSLWSCLGRLSGQVGESLKNAFQASLLDDFQLNAEQLEVNGSHES